MRLFLAVTVGVVAVLLGAAQVGAHDPTRGPIGGDGTFFAQCTLSKRAPNDPIVFPRAPGMSHLHDFIGGKVTAFSTGRKLLKAGKTTCVRPNATGKRRTADKSGYWVPALLDAGRPVFPGGPGVPGVSTYYFTGSREFARIKPFPAGLRMIAGSSEGRKTTSSTVAKVFDWTCGGTQILPPLAVGKAPTCSDYLKLEIRFPDCWNGTDRDSKDHRSHMAYSVQANPGNNTRVCPSTHPVMVPMLSLSIRYPTKGGPGVTLASGDLRTTHGDFMNGWNQRELKRLVRTCLARDLYCGGSNGPVPGHH